VTTKNTKLPSLDIGARKGTDQQTGSLNQTNVRLFVGTMPFGGVGSSGIGHYYGKYRFDPLTHAKSILISPVDVAIEHLFPPYTPEKLHDLENWHVY
jgi:aldehyde dehydrogenase (NAD+)